MAPVQSFSREDTGRSGLRTGAAALDREPHGRLEWTIDGREAVAVLRAHLIAHMERAVNRDNYFDADQLAAVTRLCALILPAEAHSPGAVELDVPAFLGDLIAHAPQAWKTLWETGLEALDACSLGRTATRFAALPDDAAIALLDDGLAGRADAAPVAPFLQAAKATIAKAYYRTEHGLHVELRVRKVPRPAPTQPEEDHLPSLPKTHYDVIVVGSGATGAWSAKELVEKGLDVLLLESGALPTRNPRAKYPYELRFRNLFDNDVLHGAAQPIQTRLWACDEYRADFFIDDLKNPYEGADAYTWIRGAKVGGRMNMWGRQVYRYGERDFRGDFHPAGAPAWPFGYDEIAPYYDEVESTIGVSGAEDGIETLPDGRFLPPMDFTDGELHLKARVEARWRERRMIIGRTAILTVDHQGRKACRSIGHCYRGCDSSSFFDPAGTIINGLAARDNFHLQPNAKVSRLLCGQDPRRANGVEFVDTVTGERRKVFAKAVVLAASTIATTRILLASRTADFPGGVGSSSGVLGKFLHGHVHSVTCSGSVPWLRKPVGVHDEGRSNQFYIPQFQNLGERPDGGHYGGFGIEGAVKHYMQPRDLATRAGFGVAFKRSIREDDNPAHFFLTAFGTMQPREENRVTLSERVDHWGDPVAKVECRYGGNDLAMVEAMRRAVEEIAIEARFDIAHVTPTAGSPGMCIHEVGSARMGLDPATSVVDPWNRVWDMPNVLVVDGACFPNVAPQNPTLTMMAVALRASRRLAIDLLRPIDARTSSNARDAQPA